VLLSGFGEQVRVVACSLREALVRRKGIVVGYERMTNCWILLGGNMLLIACFGFWQRVSSCYL